MRFLLILILCCGLAVGVFNACGSDDDDGDGANNSCADLCGKGVGCGIMDSDSVEVCITVCENYPEGNAKNCALDCDLSVGCDAYADCLYYCDADLG